MRRLWHREQQYQHYDRYPIYSSRHRKPKTQPSPQAPHTQLELCETMPLEAYRKSLPMQATRTQYPSAAPSTSPIYKRTPDVGEFCAINNGVKDDPTEQFDATPNGGFTRIDLPPITKLGKSPRKYSTRSSSQAPAQNSRAHPTKINPQNSHGNPHPTKINPPGDPGKKKKRGKSQTERNLEHDRKDELKKKIPPDPLLKHFTCITINVQQITKNKWVSILAHPQAHKCHSNSTSGTPPRLLHHTQIHPEIGLGTTHNMRDIQKR